MRLVAALLSLIIALPAFGQAQKAAKGSKKPPAAPLSALYAAMPLPERVAVQNDLIWAAGYIGTATGEFGDRAIAAVKAFQKENGGKETGWLGARERAALSAAAKARQEAAGWRIVDDPATGTRLGIPGKLASQTGPGKSGTRFASGRGEVQIETFRIEGADVTLATVFEQQKKEPATRKVDYNVLRPDFFVVSGLQGLKKFYVRAHGKDGEVRGVSVLYDQAMEGIMDPVVIAMSSAFVPYPAGALAGPQPRRKVEYGTGIVVASSGYLVADRQVTDGCYVLTANGVGNAERVAEDKEHDLALLRIYGATGLRPAAFAGESPRAPDVTLVGIADPQSQGGAGVVTTARARLGPGSPAARPIEPAPALGFSGAAVLDSQGRIAGMVQLRSAVVAGPAPAGTAASMVPSDVIKSFLEREAVAPAPASASGLEAAKASVVRLICARK